MNKTLTMTVHMPANILDRIRRSAAANGTTMAAWVRGLVEAQLGIEHIKDQDGHLADDGHPIDTGTMPRQSIDWRGQDKATLKIRLTPNQRRAVDLLCERFGLSRSALVRSLAEVQPEP